MNRPLATFRVESSENWARMNQPRAEYYDAGKTYHGLLMIYQQSVLASNPDVEILDALEIAENGFTKFGEYDDEFWSRWNAEYSPFLTRKKS